MIRAWLVALMIAASVDTALAQRSHPHGLPPGQAKRVQPPSGASGAGGASGISAGSGSGAVSDSESGVFPGAVRTFGVWLDDASVVSAGTGWLGISVNRWSLPGVRGMDVPVVDATAGIAPRVQLGVTVPFYRIFDRGPESGSRVGDVYVTSKIGLIPADTGRLGLAVSPTLEVLSELSALFVPDGRRLQWVLPMSAEWRTGAGRLYGSAGYFSRGVTFAGGAYERWIGERVAVTGALTHSYATREDESATFGLSRRRVDGSGSVAYTLGPDAIAYAGISRTLTQLDPDSTRFAINAGVSMQIRRKRPSREGS